jgi:hypothetical protein
MEFLPAILALVLVVAGVLVFRRNSGSRAVDKARIKAAQKLARSIPAEATIVAVEKDAWQPADSESRAAAMRFVLDVQPPSEAPYQTSVLWLVEPAAAGRLYAGEKVHVKIDADDRNVVYPAVSFVNYAWPVRGRR